MRRLHHGQRQGARQNQPAEDRNGGSTIRMGQRKPHLQFDGTAKHSVYATAQQRTKRGTLGSRGSNNTILDGLTSRSVAPAREAKASSISISRASGTRQFSDLTLSSTA